MYHLPDDAQEQFAEIVLGLIKQNQAVIEKIGNIFAAADLGIKILRLKNLVLAVQNHRAHLQGER